MLSSLIDTLSKWKKFFALNSDVIMSEQMQEGLYGELLVLKKLLFCLEKRLFHIGAVLIRKHMISI